MYYYIFEPSLEAKEYERVSKIKDYLSTLGIAGEMVSPTPGRTIEDLVELAVAKRYSTIVAVGGSELINRVARSLEPYDTVLGIIPLRENADMTSLIGANDWKQAAEQLKRRRHQPVRLGRINDELCFLTPASIEMPVSCEYSLTTPTFSMKGKGGTLRIAPSSIEGKERILEVELIFPEPKKGFLSNLFGEGSGSAPRDTRFTTTELHFESSVVLPVHVAGSPICQTPIDCTTQDKPVKLIIGRGL